MNDDVTRVLPSGKPPATNGDPVPPSGSNVPPPARALGAGPAAIDSQATVITGAGAGGAPVSLPPSGSRPDIHEAGALPAGSRLAEFEITNLIGQGGFGAVYEAWVHTLERVVAIKEYLPVSLSTRLHDGSVVPLSERHRETFDLGMRSFINESRLLAQFDHPSLLKVYRFWQERGTTYMVMPFYRGQTLREALNAIPSGVDEGWLMRIMDGVTHALEVMHAARCYHRDIAPDNIILLEGSGRPVVLDFGAARRVITDKTQAITVILKPGYAPIEQYAEMPDMAQGPWTDVYALAAVMHVAVCGRPPPPSVARMLSDSYQPLSGNALLRERYSAQLLAAIDSGLAVRPASRPQSMSQLREALGLETSPTGPAGSGLYAASHPGATSMGNAPKTTPGAPSAPTEGAPRRAGMVGAAALAIALLVAGGGAWWYWTGAPLGDTAALGGGAAGDRADKVASGSALPSTSSSPASPSAPGNAGGSDTETLVPPPPAPTRTPLESIAAIAVGATPDFRVQATPQKREVEIKKDKLSFEIKSSREGYAYVYLLSTDNNLFLLFPNLLDKYNKVAANTVVNLPRASWPMNAGGPAGINHFVVVVSEHERDFSSAGIQTEGVFPQFPLGVLRSLEATRREGTASPLLGKPDCADKPDCKDVFGVAAFDIVEK